jgi:hypothetical protein
MVTTAEVSKEFAATFFMDFERDDDRGKEPPLKPESHTLQVVGRMLFRFDIKLP